MPGCVRKNWHQNIENPQNFVEKIYFLFKKIQKILDKTLKIDGGEIKLGPLP